MTKKSAITGCLVLVLLTSVATGVQGSDEDKFNPCPSDQEWSSTLDPQIKPSLWFYVDRVYTKAISESGEGDNLLEDDKFLRFIFDFSIHTYQKEEYSDYIRDIYFGLISKPAIKEHYSQEALSEMSECISGSAELDCAAVAYRNGYIPSLETTTKHDSVSKAVTAFRDWCEETTLNLRDE
ncbi:hypothetical protein ABVF61_05315 [Roseibium sp. HPY-6]|uniref:hypothetical protein n=1 Tax=Roseibium sp. HPY-6 TaxID=3229852 RepID=UPI00338E55E4